MNKTLRTSFLFALGLALVAPVAFAVTPTKITTAPAAAAVPQQSWADLDGDKDGKLSKTEAAAAPSLGEVFDKADANADGSLSGDEYRAFVDAATKANADASYKK